MRSTLSPVFTGSKMKQMFYLLAEVGQQMSDYLKTVVPTDGVMEMKDTLSRFTMDVIASTNFGIKINSLRDRDNEFYEKVQSTVSFKDRWVHIKLGMCLVAPKLAKLLRLAIIPAHKYKFFLDLMSNTERVRKETKIHRPDLISILIDLKRGSLMPEESSQNDDIGFATVQESEFGRKRTNRQWSDDELNAQAFIFLFAGFEAVSNALTFTTYELARNPDIQQRLINEIDSVAKEGHQLTYEALQRMTYLDHVVSEGLRLWTVSDVSDRLCSKDYTLELHGGKKITIKKDSVVWFPNVALHLSEEYYENAQTFNPDRFTNTKINPSTYLPFGIGPRNCIGSRFALMEIKAALYYLLLDFKLEVTEKTQIPFQLAPGFSKIPTEGVWLKLTVRQK